MNRTRWLFLGCAVGSIVLAGGLEACSGDGSNGDAGPDGTTSDAPPDQGSSDAGSDSSSSCPTYTGSAAYCKAAVANCNACNSASSLTACQLANFAQVCENGSAVLSQAALSAATDCESMCGDAGTECIRNAVADASLTTAQQKFVTDYCNTCKDDAGKCVADPSLLVKIYDDTLAAKFDQYCIPDASSSCPYDLFCLIAVAKTFSPPDPCADAAAD